ncbi:MAG: dTDP-4-dehydrorhamnose reductase [Ignavibacteriales bacterium]|nr:MAG: dTDP-4-dehydrorhamnose reductase [Ignavibacteriales bacterium]
MKILVTGAAGMLAAEVVPELISKGHTVIETDINLRLPSIEKLDFTDIKSVEEIIIKNKPDFIFHLAALTDVDLCEKDPDLAYRVNFIGTENIALMCYKYEIPLLYISTGGVFNGQKPSPYTEFDIPDPVNKYADSKLRGETIIQNLLTKYFILRAGWMIGGGDIDKKFVFKIVQQLKEGKTELNVVNDKFGSPCFTFDFAKQILPIVETGRYGIYHIANGGMVSRFEIASRIVELMKLSDKVKINAINSAQFPLPAPRARSEAIENYKLKLLEINLMPHWQKSLERYLAENYE